MPADVPIARGGAVHHAAMRWRVRPDHRRRQRSVRRDRRCARIAEPERVCGSCPGQVSTGRPPCRQSSVVVAPLNARRFQRDIDAGDQRVVFGFGNAIDPFDARLQRSVEVRQRRVAGAFAGDADHAQARLGDLGQHARGNPVQARRCLVGGVDDAEQRCLRAAAAPCRVGRGACAHHCGKCSRSGCSLHHAAAAGGSVQSSQTRAVMAATPVVAT